MLRPVPKGADFAMSAGSRCFGINLLPARLRLFFVRILPLSGWFRCVILIAENEVRLEEKTQHPNLKGVFL